MTVCAKVHRWHLTNEIYGSNQNNTLLSHNHYFKRNLFDHWVFSHETGISNQPPPPAANVYIFSFFSVFL